MMEKLAAVEITAVEEVVDDLGKGLAAVVMSDAFCHRHLRKRVAARFEDDPRMARLHEESRALHSKVIRLHRDLTLAAQEAQAKLKERWETAERVFGLVTDKYSYQIDEESGTIHQVDLDCSQCTGKDKVRQARQVVSEKLVNTERTGNDGTRPAGEESPKE